jgi:transcriptional regulator with AAA-type ATPase domain
MPRVAINTQELYKELSRAIHSHFNLVLEGESEVGKEYFARLVHQERDWGGRFVVWDCEQTSQKQSDMVKQLISLKFMDELRQSAKKDTFFIRRLDLLKGQPQAQLFDFFERLVENGKFCRKELLSLGIIGSVQVNEGEAFPVASQLNKLLDILFCLRIKILPLRERKAEIPKLAEQFLSLFNQENKRRVNGISSETVEILTQYNWPNNVCELRMEIERATALTKDHEQIMPTALSEHLLQSALRTNHFF